MVFNFFLTQLSVFSERKREGKEDWKEVRGEKERKINPFYCFFIKAGHQSGKMLSQELVDGLCAGVSLVSQNWREHHPPAAQAWWCKRASLSKQSCPSSPGRRRFSPFSSSQHVKEGGLLLPSLLA